MASNEPNMSVTPKRGRTFFAGYIYPVLPLCGLMIFSGVFLVHTLRQGVALSREEKLTYLCLLLLAGFFILAGIWARTQSGICYIAKLMGVSECLISDTRQHKRFLFLECLTVFWTFTAIFLFSLDSKLAVYNLDAARYFNDTPGYVRTGSYSLLDSDFWVGERPFTIPLFYKAVGYTLQNFSDQGEMERVGRIQLSISILSWTLFALSVSLLLKKWMLKFLSFAVITMIGASLYITFWDRLMLSDSLSTSLFVLILAFLVFAAILWRKKTALAIWLQFGLTFCIIVVATFYSFTRDPNAYFLLSLGGLMGLGLLFRSVRRHRLLAGYMTIMLSFWAVSGIQSAIANNTARYVAPLLNVLVYRFFPDEEKLAYLLENEMPYDQRFSIYNQFDLRQMHDHLSLDDPSGQLTSWITFHGKGTLFAYIVSHPGYAFITPLADLQALTNGDVSAYRKILAPTPIRLSLLSDVFYPRFEVMPILFVILFGISISLAFRNRSLNLMMIMILILFITSIPFLLLVWHTDWNDIARHSLQAALQLRLASWLCILFLTERAWMFMDKLWINLGARGVTTDIVQV
ncbi:MAG: hypothetical protein HY781_01790 [Chloroflexi bacterium]|nr:hypothetical protein [Chloroflexota bacterium]